MKFPRKYQSVSDCIACFRCDGNLHLRKKYAQINFNGEIWLAHRLAFHLNVKEIERSPQNGKGNWVGILICHTCDNKWCINPNHLYIGNHISNSKDFYDRAPENFLLEKSKKATEIQKDEAYRKRMSEKLSAVPRTEIWKERIRKASLKRSAPTLETRTKMSLSAKARCQRQKELVAEKMANMRARRGKWL